MSAPRPGSGAWRARYGPWAVVTGATSGIGEAVAREVASHGLHVLLVARRADRLRAIAGELEARAGVRALPVAADLSSDEGLRLVTEAAEALDVGLFVVAAGFGTSGPFVDSPLRDEVEMLAVNCHAVLVHAHEFTRRFVARGRGGLVLFGSIVAHQGVSRATQYAATKAWAQTFGEGLRRELAGAGVDVLVSAPGPVHSGFARRAGMTMSAAVAPAVVARATVRALGRRGTVVPGALSRLLTYSLAPLPRWARSRIMSAIMTGMTER